MSRTTVRWLRLKLICALCITVLLFVQAPFVAADEPTPRDDIVEVSNQARVTNEVDPRAMEVSFTDGSVLMLVLVDERIELVTPHGTLQIPTAGIQRIQFAPRMSAETQAKIGVAIENLGHADDVIAKAAEAELWAQKEKAFSAIVAAQSSTNVQLVSRATALREKLEKQIGDTISNSRGDDVIELADDRIVGKISAASIKIKTSQFGELSMKLADVRNLRAQALIQHEPEEEAITVLPDPGDLGNYAGMIGKKFHFRVTGSSGSIYGTDVYTTDSELATAAVHAGIVAIGETGVVAVEIVTPPGSFASSTRNGITSSPWGSYGGAYKILKDKSKREKPAPQVDIPIPRGGFDPFGAFDR